MEPLSQAVDPRVSRRKFDREVSEFRSLARAYRERGWFLADAEFPVAVVAMAARNVKPTALVTGVRFDYTDYDLRPPSVRLVDPLTAEPFLMKDAPSTLKRRVAMAPLAIEGLPEGMPFPTFAQDQPLLQAYGPDDTPFVCVAGVREYHDHPGHSGDAWELHRASGAGRMVRILELIDKYGPSQITGFQVEVRIAGYTQADIPE